jgi:BMFP domain-containing protein YqiC
MASNVKDGAMQTKSPLFDGVAKVIAEAAGTVDGVRREAETVLSSQLQRFLAEQDLVTREEFETVQALAEKLREEVAELKAELEATKTGA